MTTEERRALFELAQRCALTCLAGQKHVTVSLVAGAKRPAGMPRGELLSVGTDGSRNYSMDVLRVLAWIQKVRA